MLVIRAAVKYQEGISSQVIEQRIFLGQLDFPQFLVFFKIGKVDTTVGELEDFRPLERGFVFALVVIVGRVAHATDCIIIHIRYVLLQCKPTSLKYWCRWCAERRLEEIEEGKLLLRASADAQIRVAPQAWWHAVVGIHLICMILIRTSTRTGRQAKRRRRRCRAWNMVIVHRRLLLPNLRRRWIVVRRWRRWRRQIIVVIVFVKVVAATGNALIAFRSDVLRAAAGSTRELSRHFPHDIAVRNEADAVVTIRVAATAEAAWVSARIAVKASTALFEQ